MYRKGCQVIVQYGVCWSMLPQFLSWYERLPQFTRIYYEAEKGVLTIKIDVEEG